MRYFLDCEFNGYRGDLISLALVREDGQELYLAWPRNDNLVPWVAENVMPIIDVPGASPHIHRLGGWGGLIEVFLRGDPYPVIVADWPDDIRYFCECLITGPGTMVDVDDPLQFEVRRVDAYPTELEGAVQHNALWDARALRHKLMEPPRVEAYRWRYQRKESWGDIWRQTNEDPNRPGFFENPDDWTVEGLL